MSWRDSIPTHDVTTERDLLQIMDRPSLFLSAGVPRRDSGFDARPREITAAVVALVRLCFHRKLRLVFGAQPGISPMVLLAAREAQMQPGSVIVFQSLHFEDLIPQSTLELARWDAGHMFLTPPQPGSGTRSPEQTSLTFMRTLMLQVRGLCGAVFIGGMDGLYEEDDVFVRYNRDMPRFAVASTGGAAERMLDGSPDDLRGPAQNRIDAALLREEDAYSYVMKEILDRLPTAAGSVS